MSERLEPFWLLGLAFLAGLGIVEASRRMPEVDTVPVLEEKIRREMARGGSPSPALRERLANALIRAERPGEAMPELKKVIAAEPGNVTAPLSLARLYIQQRQVPQAQEVLATCLQANPNDPACNELLADLLVQSLGEENAMPRASKLYRAAHRGDPTRARSALVVSQLTDGEGNLNGAVQVLVPALAANPKNAPLLLQGARLLTKAKLYNEAQNFYGRATALDPTNADALCEYGAMMVDAGRPVAAEGILRESLALKPKNPIAQLHLARALRELFFENKGSMAAAERAFADAITLKPNHAPTYYEWAKLYVELGQEAYAIKYLEDATTLDDRHVEAWTALAKLRMYARDPALHHVEKGLFALGQAVNASGKRDMGLLVAYAKAQARIKNFDAAIDLINLALKLNPTPQQREGLGKLQQDYVIALSPPEDSAEGISIELLLPVDPLKSLPGWPSAGRAAPGLPSVKDTVLQPLQLTTQPQTQPSEPHP